MAAIINKRVPRDLPTGQISMSQVNVELGHEPDAPISLGQEDVRDLAEKPTGQISMSDLQGKSSSTNRLSVGYNSAITDSRGFSVSLFIGDLQPREITNAPQLGPMIQCSLNDVLNGGDIQAVVRPQGSGGATGTVLWKFPKDSGLADITLVPETANNWWQLTGIGIAYWDYLSSMNGNVIDISLVWSA